MVGGLLGQEKDAPELHVGNPTSAIANKINSKRMSEGTPNTPTNSVVNKYGIGKSARTRYDK